MRIRFPSATELASPEEDGDGRVEIGCLGFKEVLIGFNFVLVIIRVIVIVIEPQKRVFEYDYDQDYDYERGI